MNKIALLTLKHELQKLSGLKSIHTPSIHTELRNQTLKAAPGIKNKTMNSISAKNGSQRKTPGIS